MSIKRFGLACAFFIFGSATNAASAEDLKLTIASGHPRVATWINLVSTLFVPGDQARRRTREAQGRIHRDLRRLDREAKRRN